MADQAVAGRPAGSSGGAPRSSRERARWRRRLADEREAARVYADLAARSSGEEREILLALADAEERHAAHWAELLGDHVGALRRGSPRTSGSTRRWCAAWRRAAGRGCRGRSGRRSSGPTTAW